MKNLIYSLGIIISLSLIITCQKSNDLPEQEPVDPALNSRGDIKICHIDDEGVWHKISIDENSWPTHEAHGDKIRESEFPQVGNYNWTFYSDGSEHLNTMVITAVTATTFSGWGKDHEDNRYWDIVNGTIDEDFNVSFTVDYRDSNDYLDCSGSYDCDMGNSSGSVNGTETGTWAANLGGELSDDNEVIPIDP